MRMVLEKMLLVYNYLKNRNQRVKINTTFSTWTDLISGVFIVVNGMTITFVLNLISEFLV